MSEHHNITEVDVHDGNITFRVVTFAMGSILMLVVAGFVSWSLLNDVSTIENTTEIRELRALMKANQEAILLQSEALKEALQQSNSNEGRITVNEREIKRMRDDQAAEFRERARLYNERRGGMQLQPRDGGSGSP